MAMIDLSKVNNQQQPADADRDRYEASDRNIGAILPNSCDEEVLVSGFNERDEQNAVTGDNPDAFAFDGNSGEFALGGDNDLDAANYEDFSTDPEFIKRQMEELERIQKMN